MSADTPFDGDVLSPEQARRREAVCDRYEHAWNDGQAPRAEDFLDGWDGPGRAALERELIQLELYYRWRRGEDFRADDYRVRFPALDPNWLAAAVAGAPPSNPGFGAATASVRTPSGAEETPGPARLPTPPESPEELSQLGTYHGLKLLGQGGMGTVFAAQDVVLGRQVALKVMKPHIAKLPGAKDRFLREARAAAALQHDNIVPVYHVGEEGGVPFIAMPLLAGESLEDRLKREPTASVANIRQIGREAALGLAAAHAAGLVHRDIKPSNLWLEALPREPGADAPRFRVKLLDFGLARASSPDGDGTLSYAGSLIGTPSYMSPEQVDGKPLDGRSDLFSLGCVLYRLAAGEAPFQGATLTALLRAVAEQTPAPLRDRRPELPAALSSLVDRLLAKDPAGRPATASEVASALSASADEAKPSSARPAPAGEAGNAVRSATVWGEEAPPAEVKPLGEKSPEPRRRRWSWTFKVSISITISFCLMFSIITWGKLGSPPPDFDPGPPSVARVSSDVVLQEQVAKEVETRLAERDFPGATAQLRVALAHGAGPEWAAAQHERVRAVWLQSAEAKPTAETRLSAFNGLLQAYPDDSIAKAKVETLRTNLARQKRLGEELETLLARNDFRGAVVQLRAAGDEGAGVTWAVAQREQIRQAWLKSVGSKPNDEARLAELDALLKAYPNDSEARLRADRLRGAIALRAREMMEIEKRLAVSDYRAAAARVRAAAAEGGAAWADAQHERVRALWRQSAGAKPTEEAQLAELDALLRVYPGDSDAQPRALRLRNALARREGDVRGAVALVLDYSGSMNEMMGNASKLARAQTVLRQVLAELPPGTHLSIRVYGHKPTPMPNANDDDERFRQYTRATQSERVFDADVTWGPNNTAPLDELMKMLKGLKAQGGTPLVRSMREAKADFPKNHRGPRTLLVLTDGADTWYGNSAPTGRAIHPDVIGRVRKEFEEAFAEEKDLSIQMVVFTGSETEWAVARQQFEAVAKFEQSSLLARADNPAALAEQLNLASRLRTQTELRTRVAKDVERRLGAGDFRGAAAQVRAAEGAGAAWAAEQHQRVRDAWRQFADAKPTGAERLRDLDAFLKEYPGDAAAAALVGRLRGSIALQEQVGNEVDKLLARGDFRGAAAQVRVTEAKGAGAAWAAEQHERVRRAWRQLAAAKPTDEARLAEYEALLKDYANDPAALAVVNQLRNQIQANRWLDLGAGVKLALVEIAIPPGGRKFPMGSPVGESGRMQHEGPWEMTLARGYLLGEAEVTVAQFRRFVQERKYVTEALRQTPPLNWQAPAGLKEQQADDHPVVCVTWSDAVAFCEWLSAKTGRKCRLPTEAEWEYACRSGTDTPFAVGQRLAPKDANFNGALASQSRAEDGPPRLGTAAVRRYPPNAWRLYDMHGNVAEWCADPYRDVPLSPGAGPQEPNRGANEGRVARGGSWMAPADECRSAYRWKRIGSTASNVVGFRVLIEQ